MGIPKQYWLEDFDQTDYILIAIHSSRKEDYKVVYSINTHLQIWLAREAEDLSMHYEEGVAHFSHFHYQDEDNHVIWKVVSNKAFIKPDNDMNSPLFSGRNHAVTKQGYLMPELKNVDYFIKIENVDTCFEIGKIIEQLNTIKIFSTAYEISQEKIKNKNHLIF